MNRVRKAIFHPAALAAIRRFPKTARRAIGEAVLALQWGARIGMPLSRPMPSIAPGVQEPRVRDRDGIYREFYLVRVSDGAFVFHAFEKRTQKSPPREIELAKKRLSELRR